MEHFDRAVFLLLFVVLVSASQAGKILYLRPGDKAPPFSLQTHNGAVLSYAADSTVGTDPYIFIAFTNESGFLENLFSKPKKLFLDLFEHSPDNTHYVFMFHDSTAFNSGAKTMQNLDREFNLAVYYYHGRKWIKYREDRERANRFFSKHRTKRFPSVGPPSKNLSPRVFREYWRKRLHFAEFPVHKLGNWIPRLLAQWACPGKICGFDQIAIENQEGSVLNVFRRLDSRYSWLPSLSTLITKYPRLLIVIVSNACAHQFQKDVHGSLALVSMGEKNCSIFTKIKNCQTNGALGVIVYAARHTQLQDLNCHGVECETLLSIPATMIHNEDGYRLTQVNGLFARFQTTPSDAFVFGIDGQGRVQKTEWFLYPDMRFLAYQSQWFDYVTDFVRNSTGDVKVVKIFKNNDLQGIKGIVSQVDLPSYNELQLYRNVELDMSLTCPGTGSEACTHWDHVIRLYVSCDPNGKIGSELGRWIMAYERRNNHWTTPVTCLLPLLKCNALGNCRCNFTMMTASWVMPWTVTLDLRLSDKMKHRTNYSTWREIERTLVPADKINLFTGRLFDENYNKGFIPKQFTIPQGTSRVKLVATITGHGRDNNNCAGACITSHHFVVNGNYTNSASRIYKSAGLTSACTNQGVEGNYGEDMHATWLLGREDWCDGQEIVPWEVDITEQVRFGKAVNSITYHGWFNGVDPKPTQDPGTILMASYVVFYKYKDHV